MKLITEQMSSQVGSHGKAKEEEEKKQKADYFENFNAWKCRPGELGLRGAELCLAVIPVTELSGI